MGSKNMTVSSCEGNLQKKARQIFRRFGMHQLMMLALITAVAMGTEGCKAKKEARARQEALEAKIAEAKATLLAIINDKTMSVEDKESELDRVKAMSLQDPEILDLIDRAEAAIAEQRAAEEKARAAEKKPAKAVEDANTRINNIFQEVANASSNEMANAKIREAMNMFSSSEVPVLIIISQNGGQNDYDEPTTIQKYLEYLKDTKSKPAAIHNLEYDASGKIKEVELIKRY